MTNGTINVYCTDDGNHRRAKIIQFGRIDGPVRERPSTWGTWTIARGVSRGDISADTQVHPGTEIPTSVDLPDRPYTGDTVFVLPRCPLCGRHLRRRHDPVATVLDALDSHDIGEIEYRLLCQQVGG